MHFHYNIYTYNLDISDRCNYYYIIKMTFQFGFYFFCWVDEHTTHINCFQAAQLPLSIQKRAGKKYVGVLCSCFCFLYGWMVGLTSTHPCSTSELMTVDSPFLSVGFSGCHSQWTRTWSLLLLIMSSAPSFYWLHCVHTCMMNASPVL